jgi:hypothetical protein
VKGRRVGGGASVAEVSSCLRPVRSNENVNDGRDGHAMCLGLCIVIVGMSSCLMHFDLCGIILFSFSWVMYHLVVKDSL